MNNHLETQRILVIGCGFIGSAVVRAAARAGGHVRVLSRSRPDLADTPDAEIVIGDASHADTVLACLEDVDRVIYALGDLRRGIGDSTEGGEFLKELPALLATLEACRLQGTPSFTYVSSGGTVYGEAEVTPIPETHPTNPLVSYGIMKLACEKYVLRHGHLQGTDARIVRCANAYGAGQPTDRPQGVIPVFLDRIARGVPVTIYGDGSAVRDFVHVDDVAAATLALGAAPPRPAIVNLGAGVGTSLNDLIALIEKVTQRKMVVRWEPHRAFDVHANVLDITRLRGLIAFEPMSLVVGVRRTWQEMFPEGAPIAQPASATS